MTEFENYQALDILDKRFGCDSLIALATCVDNKPSVRTVDAYYEKGSFYIVTNARSGKMQQIGKNPIVAVSGEWFTAHGEAENIGYICNPKNHDIADKLRTAFAEWYEDGDVDESDTDTIILRVWLKDAVLFDNGKKYDLNFDNITDKK